MPKKPKLIPAKLPEDCVESARVIAGITGRQMGDIFGDILRPALDDLERKALAERTQAIGTEGRRRGGA